MLQNSGLVIVMIFLTVLTLFLTHIIKLMLTKLFIQNTLEMSSIIDSIKGGKSVGPDGISLEHIYNSNNCIIQVIVLLINNMLRHSYFPKKLIASNSNSNSK